MEDEQRPRACSECRTGSMDRIATAAGGYWECPDCGWIALAV